MKKKKSTLYLFEGHTYTQSGRGEEEVGEAVEGKEVGRERYL